MTTDDVYKRLQVAQEKGLPAAAAGRLHGNTLEELRADADAFATEFGDAQPGALETDPAALAAGVPGGFDEQRPIAGSSDPTLSNDPLDPAALAASVPR